MRKTINKTYIEGLLYQHSLEVKESGPNSKNPGTKYITGSIDIATDNALTNIVPVHFTYVTAVTSTGKENAAFGTLMNIVNNVYKNVMADGATNATQLRIDSAIGLNEFYTERDGKEEFVSVKRNEGGFIHVTNELKDDENERNTFDCDMIINKVTHIDADPERETPDKAIVKGFVFDFRGALLPTEFSVLNPNAINYFEGLEATDKNPVFTRIRGRQISETIVKQIEETSAWGDTSIRTVKNSRKDFVITWAASDPYIWDDDSSITAAEMAKLLSEREVYLATMRTRNEEYKASKKQPAAAPAAAGFNF